MVVQLGVRRMARGLVFLVAAAMVCFAVASPSLGGTVLLDDTWADGSRTDPMNLPTESPVYVSHPDAVTMAAGSLTYAQSGSSQRLNTYFTDLGSPSTLAVGEMLKATIDFIPKDQIFSTTSRNFRVGLFYDPTGRVTTDGYNDSGNGEWPDAQGYAVFFPITPGPANTSPFQINKRTVIDGSQSSLLGSASAYTTSPSDGDQIVWAADQLYTLILELCKVSEDQMDITATVLDSSGVLSTHTVSDDGTTFGAASIYDTFDMLAFRFSSGNGTAAALEFRNFRIEVGSKIVIPEPTSLALLGLAGLALVGVARRRQS